MLKVLPAVFIAETYGTDQLVGTDVPQVYSWGGHAVGFVPAEVAEVIGDVIADAVALLKAPINGAERVPLEDLVVDADDYSELAREWAAATADR